MEKRQLQILVTNKVDMAARLHAISSVAFGFLLQICAAFWANLAKFLCTHPATAEQNGALCLKGFIPVCCSDNIVLYILAW
jgi:hypothetical protein